MTLKAFDGFCDKMMSKIATNFEEEESKTKNFRAARALSDISIVHPVNRTAR